MKSFFRSIEKNKAKNILILILIIVTLFLGYKLNQKNDNPIRQGSISQNSQAELNENEFIAFCNTNIIVEDNYANIMIENNENNFDPCIAKLISEDGTLLYESDILYPGFYIEKAKLFENLEKGKYDAIMQFELMNGDSVKGAITFDVSVNVK